MADEDNKAKWQDGKFVFPLERPIAGPDGQITELVFREPTGADILDAGNPIRFDPISDPPRVDFEEKKMGAMLALLAGVPPSVIRKLAPRDLINAGWVISPFFIPV